MGKNKKWISIYCLNCGMRSTHWGALSWRKSASAVLIVFLKHIHRNGCHATFICNTMADTLAVLKHGYCTFPKKGFLQKFWLVVQRSYSFLDLSQKRTQFFLENLHLRMVELTTYFGIVLNERQHFCRSEKRYCKYSKITRSRGIQTNICSVLRWHV